VIPVVEDAHLPKLVRSYLGRSLPPDGTVPRTVRVEQTGQMWKTPKARAMVFQATEDFAVERVAFSWRARFPIIGPLAITVVDGFADGVGQLPRAFVRRGMVGAAGGSLRLLARARHGARARRGKGVAAATSASWMTSLPIAGIDLYWLPLGAGGHSVRLNGRVFEAVAARLEHRDRCNLYHSALEVRVPEGRFVIEQAPVRPSDGAERGVVAEGPVGTRAAGRLRLFRYEVRRWREGTIPDIAEAVESPQRLSEDPACARRLLALVPAGADAGLGAR
jgi:hypothetical protein